jgi:hypothetical protein
MSETTQVGVGPGETPPPDMVAGLELGRSRWGDAWHWTFPNGSARPASISEVLLWEILRELRKGQP